ncbi:unnamed protein product, partial [Rotaria socialis]
SRTENTTFNSIEKDQINEKQTESAASLPTTVPIIRSEVSLIPTANESKIAKHKSA